MIVGPANDAFARCTDPQADIQIHQPAIADTNEILPSQIEPAQIEVDPEGSFGQPANLIRAVRARRRLRNDAARLGHRRDRYPR